MVARRASTVKFTFFSWAELAPVVPSKEKKSPSCLLQNLCPAGAIIISDRFRQFFFSRKPGSRNYKPLQKSPSWFVIYSQNEKYDTFFIDFTCVCKIWNKCWFFVRNGGLFWGFVFDIAQVNFLKLLLYLTNREKSQNEKLLEFFQLFAFFSKIGKSQHFSALSVRPPWLIPVTKMARN